MSSSRPERVGEQVRAELCALLRTSASDPALRLVTVTHVRMSRDLQHARVYYTSADEPRQAGRGLRRAASFLRGRLGRRLRLRHVPDLTFVRDDAIEREQRIAQVLEELQLDRPAPPPGPEPPPADASAPAGAQVTAAHQPPGPEPPPADASDAPE